MAMPCLFFEYEYRITNQERTPGDHTPDQRTPGKRTPGKRTTEKRAFGKQTPGKLTPGDMVCDFQFNAFKFTGHRISLTGDSIEDAILQACCVLNSQKETVFTNSNKSPGDGNAELPKETPGHQVSSCAASAEPEPEPEHETHMDSKPAVPMNPERLPVSLRAPMKAFVESAKVEDGEKHDSDVPKVLNDCKGHEKPQNGEKENEHHLELQDTAVQSFSVEELVAQTSKEQVSNEQASNVLESVPKPTAIKDMNLGGIADQAKAEQAKAEHRRAEQRRAEQVVFGAFEEEFFNSYVPPAQPLTEEELLEMKDGAAPKHCFKGSHRTISKRRIEKKRRGFIGWLTAVFYS